MSDDIPFYASGCELPFCCLHSPSACLISFKFSEVSTRFPEYLSTTPKRLDRNVASLCEGREREQRVEVKAMAAARKHDFLGKKMQVTRFTGNVVTGLWLRCIMLHMIQAVVSAK